MAKIKGVQELQTNLTKIKKESYQVKLELHKKIEWFDRKPNYWKIGTHGQRWAEYLYEVAALIRQIEEVEYIGRRYNIVNGEVILYK